MVPRHIRVCQGWHIWHRRMMSKRWQSECMMCAGGIRYEHPLFMPCGYASCSCSCWMLLCSMREMFDFLPLNNKEQPPVRASTDSRYVKRRRGDAHSYLRGAPRRLLAVDVLLSASCTHMFSSPVIVSTPLSIISSPPMPTSRTTCARSSVVSSMKIASLRSCRRMPRIY